MAGKRRHVPAPGERPISDTAEIHDSEGEQTIRLDASRWAGFRDAFGEREFGVDEHGRSIELLRLQSPFTPLETALKARVGRLASFDNVGMGRALGIEYDDCSGRLVLVSERVAGVRLSELLERAFGRSLLPDLAAALYVLRRLLAIADALHRDTGIAHLALAPERIVVTPRYGVVVVEVALAGAIEGLSRTEGGLPAELRLPPSSADATAGDPRLDIAHIATVAVSMILGRAFEPDEPIDPLSPVLQEVEEVAAIRADSQYASSLRQWLDRAVTVDPDVSFPTFRDAQLALDVAQPPAERVRLRPALARFVQALAFESVASADATAIELERLRAIRVRQAAARVERPAPLPTVPAAPLQADAIIGEAAPKTDDVFWRRAVAARFQMVRQQPTPAEAAPEPPAPPHVKEPPDPPADEGLRLVPPPALVEEAPPVDEIEEPVREDVVERFVETPAVSDELSWNVGQTGVEAAGGADAEAQVRLDHQNEEQAEGHAEAVSEVQAVVLAPEEPAESEETRLAWIRAVTQQLEASRSAERARADDHVEDAAPRVEFPSLPVPEAAAPADPAPFIDDLPAGAPEEVAETPPGLAIPASRRADEPTLAELHNLLTSSDEREDEKASGKKGSWLRAVKAHLSFTRRSTDDGPESEESAAPMMAPPIPEPEPFVALVPETVAEEIPEDDESGEDLDEVAELPVANPVPPLFEGLRAREPNTRAWTDAVTSALSVSEPKTTTLEPRAVSQPEAAPLLLEVVHPATSIEAPRPLLSTPVPRSTPAAPLPDFQETPGRGLPRWAIWAGLAAAVAAGGGYLYSTRSVESRPADEAPAEAPSVATAGGMGTLSVTSEPIGATVILDGTERGVTPLKLSEVPAGNHRLQLRGEGGIVSRTIAVAAGEEARVEEAIFSGWVAVFAPFELQIFADGKQIGRTGDARIMLPAGPHDLQLVNARLGYRVTHKLEVRPGEVSPLNITAPEGVVRVNAPDDAEVFVDGQRAGKGSRELSVPIGTREILVRHARGEQKELVTVTLTQPAEVTVGNKP